MESEETCVLPCHTVGAMYTCYYTPASDHDHPAHLSVDMICRRLCMPPHSLMDRRAMSPAREMLYSMRVAACMQGGTEVQ